MKEYQAKDEYLFINYLPDEVFKSLTPTERSHYSSYRNYLLSLHRSKELIRECEREIERLEKIIGEEKRKSIYPDGRIKNQVERYYEKISHLDERFKFSVYVEKRTRKSESYKVQSGEESRKHLQTVKSQYGGKQLTENEYLYGRIYSFKKVFKTSVYLGKMGYVKKFLEWIYNESWQDDTIEEVRDELKVIMSQYTRYNVFKTNWKEFTVKTHNLDKIKKWISYCEEENIDRYAWGND